ncbi:MAG: A/G-specific adenine glycosylase [Flavobacteriales bacterium]|jgi:A/G-specific adenine glycosylase|nr:A/G-specific adenine glycosylase [Flavobacteriales bacterium]
MIFSDEIIQWYKKNRRDLPWRNTVDPYKIWLSEIILQQTKVSQGLPYYNSFIDEFDTITDLANAKEDKILKLWQGLGYYSRAKNLHFTAKFIRDNYNSVFPSEYKEIRELKGVGDYTASAISSFCYDLPYAVLDGNVSRLISRYFAIETPIDSSEGKRLLKQKSQELLDIKSPAIYNQAIMEFGALQCVPKSPNCEGCVLKSTCKSYSTELVHLLPIKSKSLKVSNKYFNFLIITDGENTFIEKRKKGIWNSLYQFPLIEGKYDSETIQSSDKWKEIFSETKDSIDFVSFQIKHKLSHQLIHAFFYHIKSEGFINDDFIKINWDDINKYPLPRLIDKYLNSVKENL